MKLYENRWKLMKAYKSMNIHLWKYLRCDDNLQKPRSPLGIEQQILYGQQVVTYGWARASNIYAPRFLDICENHRNVWKSPQNMRVCENHPNQWQPMKIYEIRLKSSETKKPAWNQAKFSTGDTSSVVPGFKHPWPRIAENLWKPMDVTSMQNRWKYIKIDENR